MTNMAKGVLAATVLAHAFMWTLVLNALRLHGIDAVVMPFAHAFGLGLFPWAEWAQWGVLAALCIWPAASGVLLWLVANWPDGATV